MPSGSRHEALGSARPLPLCGGASWPPHPDTCLAVCGSRSRPGRLLLLRFPLRKPFPLFVCSECSVRQTLLRSRALGASGCWCPLCVSSARSVPGMFTAQWKAAVGLLVGTDR